MKRASGYLMLLAIPFSLRVFPPRETAQMNKGLLKEGGIQFMEPSWQKALDQARKEDRPVFLDAYASWCGPCKLLKRNTFSKKKAGDFFNRNFINIAIDMEKGEGPALSDKFEVDAYPTLIIADKNGNLVTFTKGYMNADELIEFGKYGLNKFRH